MNYENKCVEIDKLKTEIDKYRPLSKDALKQIHEYYKIGLTYSSNALDGNTLDLVETKVVLEDGLTINGKPLKDHLETIGHAAAFDLLLELAKNKTFTEDDIKTLHSLFYSKIDNKHAGCYREKQVIVTGADIDFPSPAELDDKMKALIKELYDLKQRLHPVEYAAMVHALFVNVHPFIDGNGRVARLLMNLALLQAGYNITIIPPVVRADYIRALQSSNHNDFKPFINFISEMVYESQKEYLKIVKRIANQQA